MIACLDVYYPNESAYAAAVIFSDWTSTVCLKEYTAIVTGVGEYEPGQFYRRELTPLQAVISRIVEPIDVYVLDAYCHLAPDRTPGLGAYFHESLPRPVAIVGVAKNRYRDTKHAIELLRGGSVRPLFVTSIGLSYESAAKHIGAMAGSYRIPTLIKAADRLSRKII